MPFVYSTLTNDQVYTQWRSEPNRPNVALKKVKINGGHGRMDKNQLITPIGVSTEVTDEELAVLQENVVFKKHVEAGYITVMTKKAEPEKVASGMKGSDASAQKTPSDFTEPPVVGNPDNPKPTRRKKTAE